MSRADWIVRPALVALLAVALGGCQEYLARSDLLDPSSGDAVAANAAIQVINPWPRSAFDPHVATQGQRLGAAMQRYNAGEAVSGAKSSGKDAPMIFTPVATSAQ